jgi:hypothetical protein
MKTTRTTIQIEADIEAVMARLREVNEQMKDLRLEVDTLNTKWLNLKSELLEALGAELSAVVQRNTHQ